MTIYLIGAILLALTGIGLWRFSRGRKRPLKIVLRIGALSAILFSPLFLLAFLFSGVVCGRYDFPPIRAPNGYWVAGVSEVDCGAMDSFHSFVQIWSSEHSLLNTRLLGSTVFKSGNDPVRLNLKWTGPNVLVIEYPNDSARPDEFVCRSRSRNVQIECIPYAPDYRKPGRNRPNPKTWFRWLW